MRITSQYVEVAGLNTDGNVCVTRVYTSVLSARVLVSTYCETVNHTISFTQNARTKETHQRITSNLTLNGTANRRITSCESVTSTLAFTQSLLRALPGNSNSTVVLTDDATYFLILEDRKGASSTLNLVQTVQCLSALVVSQDLNLTSTVNVRTPFHEYVSHHVYFDDYVPTPHRLWVEDGLSFSHVGVVPIEYTVTDTLNFVSEVAMSKLTDWLTLTQSVSVGKGKDIEHDLGINHTVFVQGYWNRLVTQNLGIGHALTWYNILPCTDKQYAPFQGENTVMTEFAQPSDTLPSIYSSAATDRMILYYPSWSVIARQLILRAPEMDNKERSSHTRINRETRGGYLIVYSDPTWPTIRTMSVTIVGVKDADVDDYLDFIRASLGKEIDIRDWEGYLWRGVITDPENPVAADGKEQNTIAFEFEGELLNSSNPDEGVDGMTLSLSDEATYVLEPAP